MTTEELIAELRATVDHDVALGLKPPLHAEIRALLDRIASLEAALVGAASKLESADHWLTKVSEHNPQMPGLHFTSYEGLLESALGQAAFAQESVREAAATLSSSKQKDGE